MTCIVACSWGGQTAIASDARWAAPDNYTCGHGGTKLRRYHFGVVGFSGTYRLLPCIDAGLRKIKRLETERDAWALAQALQESMKAHGWKPESIEAMPRNADLYLVAATPRGSIWTAHSDLAVIQHQEIAATGSGELVALGAAWACRKAKLPAAKAARRAVEAACALTMACGLPVYLAQLRGGA